VEIHVLQGEREMARDNRTLGRFNLEGLPPAQRGVPQIEVTFDIDANGIVSVKAKDMGTGKEQQITITGASGLDQGDIDRMVKDSEAHAQEDAERRKAIETRNQLDSLVYQTDKTMSEHREALSPEDVGAVETALQEARTALEGEDVAAMERARDNLTQSSHKLAEAMYKSQAAPAEDGNGSQQATGDAKRDDDEVVDAEFEDVK
jgi:molecular chaperone DnaK